MSIVVQMYLWQWKHVPIQKTVVCKCSLQLLPITFLTYPLPFDLPPIKVFTANVLLCAVRLRLRDQVINFYSHFTYLYYIVHNYISENIMISAYLYHQSLINDRVLQMTCKTVVSKAGKQYIIKISERNLQLIIK